MKTHDYSIPSRWGRAAFYEKVEPDGLRIRGHLYLDDGVEVGDFLILPNRGKTTRYRLVEVRRMRDPRDMYFFEAEFAPRREAAAP